jgi:hypothetical protein
MQDLIKLSDKLPERAARSGRLDKIMDKAYDVVELALDRVYAKLEAGEMDFEARDLVQLLQLFKSEGSSGGRRRDPRI